MISPAETTRMDSRTTRINFLYVPKSRCGPFLCSKSIEGHFVVLRSFQGKSWKTIQCLQSTKVDKDDSAIRTFRYLARLYLLQNFVKQFYFYACAFEPWLHFGPDTVRQAFSLGYKLIQIFREAEYSKAEVEGRICSQKTGPRLFFDNWEGKRCKMSLLTAYAIFQLFRGKSPRNNNGNQITGLCKVNRDSKTVCQVRKRRMDEQRVAHNIVIQHNWLQERLKNVNVSPNNGNGTHFLRLGQVCDHRLERLGVFVTVCT